MTALRFFPVDEAATAVSTELSRLWKERAQPEPPGATPIALVIAQLDATTRERIAMFFATHAQSRCRTIAVCMDGRIGALQALLAAGLGDIQEHSAQVLDVIAARQVRWAAIDAALARPLVRNNLIGASESWCGVLQVIAESALFSSAPVLLTGPTGTGKELLARLLHALDSRAGKRDLVTVDCTTLAPDLAGSELFGHERGAFTGAVGEREGALAMANGGTLFLDEIGELPLEHQARLLRALQEHTYRRIGSTVWRKSEFRLVCATNRDLRQEVSAGRFRADLYHRIAAIVCRTPALAERIDDIPLLVRHFIKRECGERHAPEASPALLEYLSRRDYEGNVRELSQLLQACLRRYAGAGTLSLSTLPEEELARLCEAGAGEGVWGSDCVEEFVRSALRAHVGLKELGRLVDAAAVRLAIAESGSLTAAALRLGVTPRALHLRKAAEREPQPGSA